MEISRNIFGLKNISRDEPKLVYIPILWDDEILVNYDDQYDDFIKHSRKINLYDLTLQDYYQCGLKMLNPGFSSDLTDFYYFRPRISDEDIKKRIYRILYEQTNECLRKSQIVSIVGGNHKTSCAGIEAVSNKYPKLTVLDFTKNMNVGDVKSSDKSITRKIYEDLPNVDMILQLGVKYFTEEELNYAEKRKNNFKVMFEHDIKRGFIEGKSWKSMCEATIKAIPGSYIIYPRIDANVLHNAIDIDKLLYLMETLVRANRKIVGFEINNVFAYKNNYNNAAELLYRLSGLALKSNNLINWRQ